MKGRETYGIAPVQIRVVVLFYSPENACEDNTSECEQNKVQFRIYDLNQRAREIRRMEERMEWSSGYLESVCQNVVVFAFNSAQNPFVVLIHQSCND